jgi:hypothetical protein
MTPFRKVVSASRPQHRRAHPRAATSRNRSAFDAARDTSMMTPSARASGTGSRSWICTRHGRLDRFDLDLLAVLNTGLRILGPTHRFRTP